MKVSKALAAELTAKNVPAEYHERLAKLKPRLARVVSGGKLPAKAFDFECLLQRIGKRGATALDEIEDQLSK